MYHANKRAWVAQSVQCLITEWTIGVRSPAKAKDFYSSLCVQTGSGAHPASCPMGTGESFPGGKARPERDADHSPHLVPSSRTGSSYISSPLSACITSSGTSLLTFLPCKRKIYRELYVISNVPFIRGQYKIYLVTRI
jgi:hypothetical protein